MGFNSRKHARRLSTLLLFGVVGLLATAQAGAKPNFSGTWKLNASKSDFGPMPAPSGRTDKITHADPSLKVTTSQSGPNGDVSFDLSYTTDGTEATNQIRGNPAKSTAKWDGDALVISTKASIEGNDITLTDKWTLSDDGKTLNISRKISTGQGDFEQKMALDKQ